MHKLIRKTIIVFFVSLALGYMACRENQQPTSKINSVTTGK